MWLFAPFALPYLQRRRNSPLSTNRQVSTSHRFELAWMYEALSTIWKEVIGVEEVGVDDNFFELGGHSVLVAQVISRVRKAFQVDLTLRAVFESPTIAGLAAEIEKAIVAEINELPEPATLPVSGELELSSKDSR